MTKTRSRWALILLLFVLGASTAGAFAASGSGSGGKTVLTATGTSQVTGTGKGCNGGGGCSGNDSGDGRCNGAGNENCNTGGGADPDSSVKEFEVSVGAIDGLYPGRNMQLPVTYTNPYSFDINVTSYTVAASVPTGTASTCAASNLAVASGTVAMSPQLNIPKKASATRNVPVGLKSEAPDGCQGVTFNVTVTAWAVKK